MDGGLSVALTLCTLIYSRLNQAKDNDSKLLGLKNRIATLLSVLEQSQKVLDDAGSALELGQIVNCLEGVSTLVDSTLEKGGVFKFAKVSNVDARIALANKQLDEQLGAFTLSALTAVVASGSTLQHGQTSLSSQIATLSDMVEKLQLQQNQSILANTTSFATTPAQALYEPTSNPPRLPSPTSRLRRDPGDPELPPCIRFGEVNKPYYLLSNDAHRAVHYNSASYPTATHLYSAYRFFQIQPRIVTLILATPSPATARLLCRQLHKLQRSDWYSVQTAVMDLVVKAKFEQHAELSKILLGTRSASFEFVSDDDWWGMGKDGKGHNYLGKSLMRVRAALTESPVYFSSRGISHTSFSGTSLHPVFFRGISYLSSQHLYQSLKFIGVAPHVVSKITGTVDPDQVWNIGRANVASQRKDWQQVQVSMMEASLRCKFDQWPDLREELKATGHRQLIYENKEDEFWGCGAQMGGRNELGKCLQRIRERIR